MARTVQMRFFCCVLAFLSQTHALLPPQWGCSKHQGQQKHWVLGPLAGSEVKLEGLVCPLPSLRFHHPCPSSASPPRKRAWETAHTPLGLPPSWRGELDKAQCCSKTVFAHLWTQPFVVF